MKRFLAQWRRLHRRVRRAVVIICVLCVVFILEPWFYLSGLALVSYGIMPDCTGRWFAKNLGNCGWRAVPVAYVGMDLLWPLCRGTGSFPSQGIRPIGKTMHKLLIWRIKGQHDAENRAKYIYLNILAFDDYSYMDAWVADWASGKVGVEHGIHIGNLLMSRFDNIPHEAIMYDVRPAKPDPQFLAWYWGEPKPWRGEVGRPPP